MADVVDITAMGREILARQPFSLGLGTELVHLEPGRAEMRIPITPALTQHLGFVHGGVIASLADMALAFAGGPMMGEGAVTAEFKINYVRPGMGEALIGRGEVVAAGKSQAVVRADVFALADGVEKLCATAQGTIAKTSGGSRDA